MLRQTVVLVAVLFSVWGLGVGMLALKPQASTRIDAVIENGRGPLYLVNTSTTSTFQDPTGRYTVFVRTALRDFREMAELETY